MAKPTRIVEEDAAAPPTATPPATPQTPARLDELRAACPNCGDESDGRFCSNCGEKRLASEDYSLRRFLGEAFHILTSFESNLFRSFATLFARPGKLTAEYFKGRRKSYLKPLQLFIFCNLIFFFAEALTGSSTLTTHLSTHISHLPHSTIARRMVESELQARKLTYENYRSRFDAAIEGQAKTLVIVTVPLYALVLQVFYWRARRYYVEHLVFSLHFFAFLLLLIAAMNSALFIAARVPHLFGLNLWLLQSDNFVTFLMLSLCAVYLLVALRRAYGQGKLITALKCLALALCVLGVIQIYRFILFFTTFYTI
jgi:hypothetical protein